MPDVDQIYELFHTGETSIPVSQTVYKAITSGRLSFESLKFLLGNFSLISALWSRYDSLENFIFYPKGELQNQELRSGFFLLSFVQQENECLARLVLLCRSNLTSKEVAGVPSILFY